MAQLGIQMKKTITNVSNYGAGIRAQQDTELYIHMTSALTLAGKILKPEPIDFSNIHADKDYFVICFPANNTLILHTGKYDYNMTKIGYGSITTPPKMLNKLDDSEQLINGAIFFVIKDEVICPLFYTPDCSAKMKLIQEFQHMQQIMDSFENIKYPFFVQAKGNKIREILMQQYSIGNNESIIGLANEKFEPFVSITTHIDLKDSYLPIIRKKHPTIEAGVPAFIKPVVVEEVEAKPPPPPPTPEVVLAVAMEESKSLPSLQKTPAMMQSDQLSKPLIIYLLAPLSFGKYKQVNAANYYLTKNETDINRECCAVLVKDESYITNPLFLKLESFYAENHLDIKSVKIIKSTDIKDYVVNI